MKRCKAYRIDHSNGDSFLIAYDYMSGHRDRYMTLVWRCGKKAKIIGRELPLGYSKRIVAAYPKRYVPPEKPVIDELTQIVKRIHS